MTRQTSHPAPSKAAAVSQNQPRLQHQLDSPVVLQKYVQTYVLCSSPTTVERDMLDLEANEVLTWLNC
jgi:hypothetical protein